MASITIRNLDDDIEARLRVRAAEHPSASFLPTSPAQLVRTAWTGQSTTDDFSEGFHDGLPSA